MYDPDRDDAEWDEEVRAVQLAAEHAANRTRGASVQSASDSELLHQHQLNLQNERPIRPLPKRKKLTVHQVRDMVELQQQRIAGQSSSSPSGPVVVREKEDDEDEDEASRRRQRNGNNRTTDRSTQPTLEYRTKHGGSQDSYHDETGDGGTQDEDEDEPDQENETGAAEDDGDVDSLVPSTRSNLTHEPEESPPTSPAGSKHGDDDPLESNHELGAEQNRIDAAIGNGNEDSTAFSLFGAQGQHIRRSLAKASAFSSAGLCGGLGLAALHPSLGPPIESAKPVATAIPASVSTRVDHGDEESCPATESAYRTVAHTSDREHRSAVARSTGNNKKKRKIPGVGSVGGVVGDDDDRSFDEHDGPEPTTVIGPDNKGRVPGMASGESSALRVPVNPPTTAKAALAKLRLRPPHVSIDRVALSYRRSARKLQRTTAIVQKPLRLPAPIPYSAPPMPRDGPPPLPPGSGLKGSKALKAAKKAQREREREKERIQQKLGGPNLRLIDLWDPEGREESIAAIRRSQKRRTQELVAKMAQDGSETGMKSFPTADTFEFVENPSPVIASRWKVLNLSINRFRIAKAKAAQAREEERERRKEKEAAAAAEAAATPAPTEDHTTCNHDSHAHDSAVTSTGASKVLTPTVPRRDAAASASTTSKPPAAPTDSPGPATANLSPPIHNPDSASPTPPPAVKKPIKKGKKKRSAHANALNVHHRDNYVPSRMPSSNSHRDSKDTHDGPLALTSWPASEEAIARAGGARPDLSYYTGSDEWLCAFCEYDLFFGPDPAKSARRRKRVLKVRKKARERASKATGGAGPVGTTAGSSESPDAAAATATTKDDVVTL